MATAKRPKQSTEKDPRTAPSWIHSPKAREAARWLAAQGGTAPDIEDIPRRRSEPSPEWAAYYAKIEAEAHA